MFRATGATGLDGSGLWKTSFAGAQTVNEGEARQLLEKLSGGGIVVAADEREVANAFPMHDFANWRQFDAGDCRAALNAQPAVEGARLYFHVPYCPSKCTFCIYDVRVGSRARGQGEYVATVDRHFESLVERIASCKSLYFGGGTPTHLDDALFERFLSLPLFLPRQADCSFNVEVHPESLTDEKLRIMKDSGVNRTSVGVQTLDDELLRRLNRTATPELVFTAIRRLTDAGFYFNADLIYGLPEQTERGLLDDVKRLIDLGIPEFTTYHLRINPRTGLSSFARDMAKQVSCFSKIRAELLGAGYVQTRPIHFVRKEFIDDSLQYGSAPTSDQKNANRGGKVFAFGTPNVVSHVGSYLWENANDVEEYHRLIDSRSIPGQRQYRMSADDADTKFFIGFIQSMRPWKLADAYRRERGRELSDALQDKLENLNELGLLEQTEAGTRVSEEGLLVHSMIERYFYP